MDDWVRKDLDDRITKLERESVRLRKGVVTDTGPLDVDLGGSGVPIEGVPSLSGLPLATDDVVAALVAGNQALVLGAIGVKRIGGLVTFDSGIVTGAGTYGPFSHNLGTTPDLILGSCQGAANAQSNRPAAAQWGWYGLSSTQFSIEIIADPVATSVTWKGFAVKLT